MLENTIIPNVILKQSKFSPELQQMDKTYRDKTWIDNTYPA